MFFVLFVESGYLPVECGNTSSSLTKTFLLNFVHSSLNSFQQGTCVI